MNDTKRSERTELKRYRSAVAKARKSSENFRFRAALRRVRFERGLEIAFRGDEPISSTQYFDEESGTYQWR